jgi:hypothetical protein
MFGHWAVVVGDHYYELVFNREVPNEASTSQSVQGQGIRLRVGNTPMPAGWHALQHKGTTTWTDEQINAAGEFALANNEKALLNNPLHEAEQLITQMSARSYHILTNNCHDFANALIRCITVAGQTRHCTVL